MSRSNIEIVQRAYEGYTRRSVDLDEIAPDFTFHMRPEFPARNAYRIDEMPKVWADLDETFTDYALAPRDFTEIGDHVLVTLDSSTRMKDSDVRLQSTSFHLWLVRDGTALEAWAHSSRDEAVEFATRRENVELIRRGFELWGATVSEEDEDAFSELLEHYAPDAVVDFSRTALDFPRATGPDGMAAFVTAARGLFDGARVEPGDFIARGDAVVVPVRFVGRGASSGATVEMSFVYAFRVTGGKVVSAASFMTLSEALDAVGLEA